MGKKLLMLGVGVAAALALFGFSGSKAAATGGPASGDCFSVQRKVALGPGQPKNNTVRGTLCLPDDWASGPPQLDILVHGATYDRDYWDWPTNYPQYSYVERTLQTGRATLAYDRIAAGTSTRPLSTSVTIDAQAYVLHQIIQFVRTIAPIAEVNVIGHSFGSMAAILEAGTYHDVDRLVATGAAHALGPAGVSGASSFYPAGLDPLFPGLLDFGYLTTLPGERDNLFYNASADPAVIAHDEATKDVVSATEFGTGLTNFLTPAPLNISAQVTAPVFVIVGDQDALICGLALDCTNQAAVQANEVPYYPQAASIDTGVVSNTGHDLTLHPSAGSSFTAINQWIQSH